MSRVPVELDFLGVNPKQNSSSSKPTTFLGMPNAICKINPHILKTVISSQTKSLNQEEDSEPEAEAEAEAEEDNKISSSLLPAITKCPLTIFYNGTVSVFHLPTHKAAEILMNLAENESKATKPIKSAAVSKPTMYSPSVVDEHKLLIERLNGDDLPIARKKSLLRFLEKRKERTKSVSPYLRISLGSPRQPGEG